jgi:hypothetical protein
MISPAMLASAVAELVTLPRLDWRDNREHGITGIAYGSDAQVREDVWEWALAFGLKPTVVDPVKVTGGLSTYASPGVIFVELPVLGVEVTVAGRLINPQGAVKSFREEAREAKAERDALRAEIWKRAGIK